MAAICVAASLWGIDGIVLTPNLFALKPGYVVFMIHLVPFLFMSLLMYKQFLRLPSFTSKDWLAFLLIGLTGGSFGTLAIVKALFLVHFQKLTIVVLLQKLQPLFAILFAGIFLKEKLSLRFKVLAIVSIFSAYFLSFGFHFPGFSSDSTALTAYFYATLAAVFFAAGTVISRYLSLNHDFKTATFYRYGFTTVIMLCWVLLNKDIIQITQTNSVQWLTLLIIAFTTGSGAIFLYYYGLKKVTASVSTICELCFPLTAVILDLILHGNQLDLTQWVSAGILVFSILLITLDYAKKNHLMD